MGIFDTIGDTVDDVVDSVTGGTESEEAADEVSSVPSGGNNDSGGSAPSSGGVSSGSSSSGSSTGGSSSGGGGSSDGGGVVDTVTDTVDDAADAVTDTADDVADTIDKSTGADEAVANAVDDAADAAGNAVETIDKSTTVDEQVADDLGRAADTASDTIDEAADTAQDVASDAVNATDNTLDRAVDTADDVADQASDTLENATDEVVKTADEVTDPLQDAADFVTSGPNETSVGDDEFLDPNSDSDTQSDAGDRQTLSETSENQNTSDNDEFIYAPQLVDRLKKQVEGREITRSDVKIEREGDKLTASVREDVLNPVGESKSLPPVTTFRSPPKSSVSPGLAGLRINVGDGTKKGPRRLDTLSNVTGTNVTVQRGEQFGDSPLLKGADQFTDNLAQTVGSVGEQAGDVVGNAIDTVVRTNAAASPLPGTAVTPATTQSDSNGKKKPAEPDTVAGRLVEGPVGLLSAPAAAPAAAVEAGEASLFAVSEPQNATEAVDDVVKKRALTTAEGVTSEPVETAGSLAVSAGLSGAAFRATQGTRLGGPVRTALQPGEEAAKFAARRGLIEPETATKIPGVREGQPGVPPVRGGDFTDFQQPDLGTGGAGSPLARADDSTDTPTGVDRGETPTRPGGDTGGIPDERGDVSVEFQPDDVTDTPQFGTEPVKPGGSLDEIAEAVESGAIGQARPEIRDLESRLDEFSFEESRAQASLVPRGRRDSTTKPELGEDRVTPNLRQQTITRRQRDLRDATEDSTFEGERSPFASDDARARRRRDLDRIDDAQRRFNERDLTTRAGAVGAVGSLLGSGIGTETGAGGRAGLDTRRDVRTDLGLTIDIGTETRSRTDTETETDIAQATDSRTEREREREAETGFGGGVSFGMGTKIRTEREREREAGTNVTDSRRRSESTTTGTGPDLGVGFLNETVTALAFGPGPRDAPAESTLADIAAPLGQRPTEAQLEASEEEEEQLAAAAGLLFAGDSRDGGGGLL